jgi:hypothetical protein
MSATLYSVSFLVIAAMVMIRVTPMIRAMIRVAMVSCCYWWSSAGRDRVRPDIAGNTAAKSIFGIGLGRGEDRCPNHDQGCGGNDERCLHAASPQSNLAFECEEQYPSYKHNGIAEITPRACGFAIYNYARGQRRCA